MRHKKRRRLRQQRLQQCRLPHTLQCSTRAILTCTLTPTRRSPTVNLYLHTPACRLTSLSRLIPAQSTRVDPTSIATARWIRSAASRATPRPASAWEAAITHLRHCRAGSRSRISRPRRGSRIRMQEAFRRTRLADHRILVPRQPVYSSSRLSTPTRSRKAELLLFLRSCTSRTSRARTSRLARSRQTRLRARPLGARRTLSSRRSRPYSAQVRPLRPPSNLLLPPLLQPRQRRSTTSPCSATRLSRPLPHMRASLRLSRLLSPTRLFSAPSSRLNRRRRSSACASRVVLCRRRCPRRTRQRPPRRHRQLL